MNYIYRHMENRILELSQSYSAILLTGPRQAGKTTMLRSLAEKENNGREYVSLDDLATRDMAKNDPALFLQMHKPPVLIDEVQYAPELFTYIKIHIDEHVAYILGGEVKNKLNSKKIIDKIIKHINEHKVMLETEEKTDNYKVMFDANGGKGIR